MWCSQSRGVVKSDFSRRRSSVSRIEGLERRFLLTLTPGNPVAAMTPTEFSGAGLGNALTAMQSFQNTIGGADNGGTPAPQSGGFRSINWDDVALDGTDFGGLSTVINSGHTVAIPTNRYQERGVSFGQTFAVSNDGLTDVNPTTANLFHSFSGSNVFSSLNNITVNINFVQASDHSTSKLPAETAGFGAIFLNVEVANTTSIEYFHGNQSLGKFFVPAGTAGQTQFLGELFPSAVVTNVQIKLGTDAVFTFSGTAITSPNTDAPPTTNLVAADDFVYSEPIANPDMPSIAGTQGQVFSGVVARFSDTQAAPVPANYTGTIDWGDGHTSPATFAANAAGGFDVTGTNTFARGGTLPVTVVVQKLNAANNQITITNPAHVLALPTLPVKVHGRNLLEKSSTPFTTTIATFTSVPGATAPDFSATINWGDGTTTAGSIVQRGPFFFVVGSHTYAAGGTDVVTTTIQNAGETTFSAGGKVTVRAPRIVPGRVSTHRAKKDVVTEDRLEDLVDLLFLK